MISFYLQIFRNTFHTLVDGRGEGQKQQRDTPAWGGESGGVNRKYEAKHQREITQNFAVKIACCESFVACCAWGWRKEQFFALFTFEKFMSLFSDFFPLFASSFRLKPQRLSAVSPRLLRFLRQQWMKVYMIHGAILMQSV
jgi:hypothetical protein